MTGATRLEGGVTVCCGWTGTTLSLGPLGDGTPSRSGRVAALTGVGRGTPASPGRPGLPGIGVAGDQPRASPKRARRDARGRDTHIRWDAGQHLPQAGLRHLAADHTCPAANTRMAGRATVRPIGSGPAPSPRAGASDLGTRSCRATASDAGVATLLTTVWMLVLVLAVSVGMAILGLWRAQARAGVAADLGSLAAAGELLSGAGVACDAARSVVLANAAELVECTVDGVDVHVVTAVQLPAGFARLATGGRVLSVRNRAHATIEER